MKSHLVAFIAAWRKYIRPTSDDYNSIPYQNVQRMEIGQLMFIQVRKVIFQDNEPRTLKRTFRQLNPLAIKSKLSKMQTNIKT